MSQVQQAPKTGRKPKNPKAKRFWDTELHKFLVPYFEPVPGLVRDGRINAKMISEKRKVSRFSVYRWFQGYLTIRGARDLCAMTRTKDCKEGTVKVEDLLRFIS